MQGQTALLQPVVTQYDEVHNNSSLYKEACVDLLTGIVKEHRQTNIIIDAFDELEDDDVRRELLESLKEVTNGSQGSVVKIFISSRDYVQIRNLMDESWAARKEILVGEKNYQDIEKFIDERLLVLQRRLDRPIPKDIKLDIEALLKERSNGMFSWVHLSLKYLLNINAKDPATFVDDLKSVPSSLEQAYKKVYDSLLQGQSPERTSTIHLILSLLMYGCQREIFQSSAFLSAINYKKTSDLSVKDVLDLCSTFVELDPDTEVFQLIHLSVKEFLQTLPQYESMAAHAVIANLCFSYLNEQDCIHFYSRSPRRTHPHNNRTPERYYFECYAAESWVLHSAGARSLRQTSPLKQALLEFWPQEGSTGKSPFEKWANRLERFKYASYVLRPIIRGGFRSLVLDSKPTTFFLSCQYDLREEVERQLSNGWDINAIAPSVGPGLSFACIGNHMELASYLIRRGAKIVLENNYEASPIFAAVECQNAEILGLLLDHGAGKALQSALEMALWDSSWKRDSNLPSTVSPRPVNPKVKMLLDHSPHFEYSLGVQRGMFSGGAELLQLLRERNPSLCVTSETLKCLFESPILPSEIISHIKFLISLNSKLVASESLLIALRCYTEDLRWHEGEWHEGEWHEGEWHEGEENPLDVIKYILNDLNPPDLSISISEAAVCAALDNFRNAMIFTEFLLQANPSMKISDDTILRAVRTSNTSAIGVIDLLLHHNPVARSFSLPDVKSAVDRFHYITRLMAMLLKSSPELEVDQEIFTKAIREPWANFEDFQALLSRASNISLTPELLRGICSDASDRVMREVVISSIPELITDELLMAALGKDYLSGIPIGGLDYRPPPLTMVELLSRAPDSLELSEETLYLVCKSTHWIMNQVFERWPSVHLSERAVEATLGDVRKLRTLVDKRPSFEVSARAITSFCGSYNHPNPVDTLKEILIFQPSIIITEEMLLAATSEPQVFEILLGHDPCVSITDEVIESFIKSQYCIRLLHIILAVRKDFHFSPRSISKICNKDDFSEVFEAILDEAFARFRTTILGESEMRDIITTGSPRSLRRILSRRSDAIVTENLIRNLIDGIKADENGNFLWRWKYYFEYEVFDMLLDRSGLADLTRQLLKAEVRGVIQE